MKHLSYRTVRSTIEKIVGFDLSESARNQGHENHPVILSWEKLLIANKIETKFGIVINDERLDQADSVEEIIRTILMSKQKN